MKSYAFVVAVIVLGASASSAQAQSSFDRRVAAASSDETIATSFATLALSTHILTGPRSAARWRGGILMDDNARNTFRLPTESGRVVAGRASDVFLTSLVAAPAADSLGASLFGARTAGETWKMVLVDAQAFSIASLVVELTKHFAARERPYMDDCRGEKVRSRRCLRRDSSRTESFLSGHTAMAFTGAGLLCAHRTYAPIYGSVSDALTCGGALTTAAMTGALRMMADRHYASDVLAGALVGVVAGFVVPAVVLGRRDSDDQTLTEEPLDTTAAITPGGMPGGFGFSLGGTF